MAETADILASIPKLVAAEDAAALVTLEEHADKKIRKAARKGLHRLRSRGVEIPDAGRSWNPGDVLQTMRGAVDAAAILDVHSVPGATRIAYSKPDDEADGTLLIALLAPDDRVLDFAAYTQTDGQRARMIRDWERQYGGRTVPADWAKQRVRWARDATIEAGHSVPPSLDDMLPVLGMAPDDRPVAFVGDLLADQKPDEGDALDILVDAGAARWPLLFDGNGLFERLGEMNDESDENDEKDEKDENDEVGATDPDTDGEAAQARRLDRLRAAAKGDDAIRTALRGPMANALEDGAVGLWMRGENARAKRLFSLVEELRSAEAPEEADAVVNLLQLQIAAVVREQGLKASTGGDHDHAHDHGHSHDHDHDHAHDHEH